ncbi:UNVERIFIED_CONTAM: hypothetical protein ABID98_003109 [Brevibacillus sp. OAP136]
MTVNWMEETNPGRFIRYVTFELHDNQALITWHWPDGIPCVYIHKALPGVPVVPAELPLQQLRLYTREEYKTHTGYKERVEGIGRYEYHIFPCVLDAGKPVLLAQGNGENSIVVSTGRARIQYSIKQRKQLFGKYQSVQIQIFTETFVARDVLCYVKKEGAMPAKKDDGTRYDFLDDFEPGTTILPEIEIKKTEHIRLFLTDGQKYGELYELIPK